MSGTEQTEVAWFLRNLDLQLDDAALAQRNVQVAFYWDAYDIRKAVLGTAAYYGPDGRFQTQEFASLESLVVSLAAAGWLGPMHMLPPHQAEFLNLVALEFGLHGRVVPPGGLPQFFRDVDLPHARTLNTKDLRDPNNIRRLVSTEADIAQKLFTTVQAIGDTWESRLASWYKQQKLILTPDPQFQFDNLLDSAIFAELRQAFEAIRPEHSINNFADAMALCHLEYLVNRFREKQSNILPRFFASSTIFASAIDRLQTKNTLTYEIDGQRYPVVRDADYYILRATFQPPRHLKKDSAGGPSLQELTTIAQQIRPLVDKGEVPAQILEDIRVDGRPLSEVIRQLRQFWFLDHVWLPIAASDEMVHRTNEHLKVAHELAKNTSFKRGVKEAVSAAFRQLQTNVIEYTWLSFVCLDLEKAIVQKKSLHSGIDPRRTDVFRISGLVRFGIPIAFRPKIQNMIAGLLSSDSTTEKAILMMVLKSCRTAARRKDEESLAIALATLWFTELDRHVDELLRRRGKALSQREETWVQIIHAAALFRAGHREPKATALLGELESLLIEAQKPIERARLAIGVAYLYYHRWLSKGGDATWRRPNAQRTGELGSLVGLAITYAKLAVNQQHEDEELKAYALNLYFFYVTEGGSDSEFQGMSGIARELLAYKANEALWNYRYDDSLARFYHRMSLCAGSHAEREEFLQIAKTHIREAFLLSCGDKQVSGYRSLLNLPAFSK